MSDTSPDLGALPGLPPKWSEATAAAVGAACHAGYCPDDGPLPEWDALGPAEQARWTRAGRRAAERAYRTLREERDTLASRGEFLKEQLDQRDAHIATLSQQLADARILAARLGRDRDELRAQLAEVAGRDQAPPEPEASYAIVEAMGHRTLIGRVTEVAVAGKAMLRVDRIDGRSQTLPPESVYMLSPCTQDEAEAAAKRIYHGSGLPPALPAGNASVYPADPWAGDVDEDTSGGAAAEQPCVETSNGRHTGDWYDGGKCGACGLLGPDNDDEGGPF